MNQSRMPSPAIVVGVLALVAALAGTAVAGPTATVSVSKKKVKKIARKQANKQIDKRLPWQTDDMANGAVNAAKVQNGALGTGEFSSSIPAARVTRAAAQSIPNNPLTPLAFNSERYDTAAMHDNTTNNSRLTAPVNGIYAVTLEVSWLFNANGLRTIDLAKNGATEIAVDTTSPPATGDQEITTQVSLQAGDFVVARAQQDSGGALSVAKVNQYSPEFSMAWLAPGP